LVGEIPALSIETQALRDAYAALNRGDVEGFVAPLDAKIEWIEPVEYGKAGTYRGHAAVMAHASQARATWAEGTCEPEQFIVAGDKIVVFVHVRVRLKSETGWREGRIADVYTFRSGKAVQLRGFADRRQALAWAGASVSDAN